MSNKPTIIELIGPSGSGKSTFVELALAQSRAFDNIETAAWRGLIHHPEIKVAGARLWRLFPIKLAYRLKLTKMVGLYRDQLIRLHSHPYENLLTSAQKLVSALDATADEKLWLMDKCINTVLNHALIEQPVNRGRLVLADEFFLQKAVRLSGGTSDNIRDYLALMPKPEGVLLFETDLDVSVGRIRSREGSRNIRARSMSDNELYDKLKAANTVARTVATTIEGSGVKKIVVRPNTDRDKLMETINQYVR